MLRGVAIDFDPERVLFSGAGREVRQDEKDTEQKGSCQGGGLLE